MILNQIYKAFPYIKVIEKFTHNIWYLKSLKILNFIFYYTHCVCIWVLNCRYPLEDTGFPEAGVRGSCKGLVRVRELNSGSLQEQQVLIIAEPLFSSDLKNFIAGFSDSIRIYSSYI